MSEVRVPEGWEKPIINQCCEILDNKRIPLSDAIRQKRQGSIPYYGANGIVDYIDDYIFDEDLILLAEDGGDFLNYKTKPIAYKISGKSWINNHAHILKSTSNYYQDYLFYSLEHKDITYYINGGTRSKLNKTDLLNIELLTPKSKKEQQKIAEILSEVDSAITLTKELIEKNKRLKTALMQNLLSYGIDENGQIRTPQTHKFKPSPLGDIPVEWKIEKLGNILKISTGNEDAQNKIEDGIYPFFVRSNTIEKLNRYSFDGEAVLTAGDGVGVGKVFHYINGKFAFHQRVYAIYNFSEIIDGKYFYTFFSNNFLQEIEKYSAKTSVDSVRLNMISNMDIAIPFLEEQQKIADILSSQDEKIEKLQNKLTKLNHLKTSLMQDLLSGKVRVNKLLESK